MRNVLALVALIAILAAPSAARAKDCPADPRKASLALWPGGSIATGKTVTGTHPCGRQLTCTGGVSGNFSTRQCRWE
jgi:hypothetical protein